MTDGDRLTLRQAREQGRVDEFVAQAEQDHREAEPISPVILHAVLGAIIKAAPAKHRTSRSRTRGDLER